MFTVPEGSGELSSVGKVFAVKVRGPEPEPPEPMGN